MCLKYDYEIVFQLNNQLSYDDTLVELRDNIEDYLIYAEVTESNEWQDKECHCNLEDE